MAGEDSSQPVLLYALDSKPSTQASSENIWRLGCSCGEPQAYKRDCPTPSQQADLLRRTATTSALQSCRL